VCRTVGLEERAKFGKKEEVEKKEPSMWTDTSAPFLSRTPRQQQRDWEGRERREGDDLRDVGLG
jgi:hypothetical protein